MKVKCLYCRHELNLDHPVFHEYSGPVKCFSCGNLMELKTMGGEVFSITSLAVFSSERHYGSFAEKRI